MNQFGLTTHLLINEQRHQELITEAHKARLVAIARAAQRPTPTVAAPRSRRVWTWPALRLRRVATA